jgi:hypothetical protein
LGRSHFHHEKAKIAPLCIADWMVQKVSAQAETVELQGHCLTAEFLRIGWCCDATFPILNGYTSIPVAAFVVAHIFVPWN